MNPTDPLNDLELASLSNQTPAIASEVLDAARQLTPAQALAELLAELPRLPSPDVVLLGDYQNGLAVCRRHAQRLVLSAWLARVAANETAAAG
jgi:hypothetical protein